MLGPRDDGFDKPTEEQLLKWKREREEEQRKRNEFAEIIYDYAWPDPTPAEK